MDHTGAARRAPFHLVRQVSEIRREYRGCKFDQNRVRRVGSKPGEILARRGAAYPCWCGNGGNGRPRPFVPGASPGRGVQLQQFRARKCGHYAPNCETFVSSEAASALRAVSTSSAIAYFSFSIPSPVTAEIG